MTEHDLTQEIEQLLASMRACLLTLDMSVSFAVSAQEDHIRIEISGEDSDCFLHKKAEGLNALQHLLRRCVEKHAKMSGGRDVPIVLDSHGYRRLREIELHEMARIASDRAMHSAMEVTLDPLNPYERRIVHLACQQIVGVRTHSVGHGFCKRVVISPAGRS